MTTTCKPRGSVVHSGPIFPQVGLANCREVFLPVKEGTLWGVDMLALTRAAHSNGGVLRVVRALCTKFVQDHTPPA